MLGRLERDTEGRLTLGRLVRGEERLMLGRFMRDGEERLTFGRLLVAVRLLIWTEDRDCDVRRRTVGVCAREVERRAVVTAFLLLWGDLDDEAVALDRTDRRADAPSGLVACAEVAARRLVVDEVAAAVPRARAPDGLAVRLPDAPSNF